jgi:hypothetical protein
MNCLFCAKDGPCSTVEHIVPESLGNKSLILTGMVCDACQAYLGKEVEKYVLGRSPIGAWRVFAGIETKSGASPVFSFRQPVQDKGRLPDRHPLNDSSVTLWQDETGERRFGADDKGVLAAITEGKKTAFRLVLTRKMLHMMARFLGMVGLEMLARDHAGFALSDRFNRLRRFVRFGEPVGFLWPIFYGGDGCPPRAEPTEIVVFDKGIGSPDQAYTIASLQLGGEMWVICLNDPYPTPIIKDCFPGIELGLITY